MTRTELESILRAQRAESLGADSGELSNERAKAMDHYHGRPYGDEQEGRSAVVSKDLAEAIDWAMPAIMRVFVSSGNIAEFVPVGPDDEDAAAQESAYVNQVIMQDNQGFILLYDACKDALMLKNGYAKHSWEETTKITKEEYENQPMESIAMLLSDLDERGVEYEISGVEEKQSLVGPTYDIELKITEKSGRAVVVAVPCEEIRVSKRCRGTLQESPFTEHVTRKTRSDLIEMGMDKDWVYTLSAIAEKDNSQMVNARNSVPNEVDSFSESISDKAMDEVDFCEAYVRVDFDGDGIAELRKVVSVNEKIPDGEEWNEEIEAVPITSFVAKRIPHRHVGESLDDDLEDLQRIKTVLTRQMLDNIYLTNNNQWAVNDRVNIKDMLQSLPGGVKRISGREPVDGAIMPLISTPIIGQILPIIDYVDGLKENRTGVSKTTSGLDPDTLRESTKGAFLENLNRASQKIEMMTRMLAETGVKELVQQVHGLLLRHQDKPRVTKIMGNYTTVNPREWKERTDLSVKVGIGTGNEQEKREKLGMVSMAQDKIGAMGLVAPKHAYALFTDLVKGLGVELPEKYAFDPDGEEFKQMMSQRQQQQGAGPGNPLAEAEQVKGQIVLQKAQFDMQVAQMKEAHKHEMDIMQMRFDANEARLERASKEAIESAKMEFQAFMEGIKVDMGPAGFGTMPSAGGVA